MWRSQLPLKELGGKNSQSEKSKREQRLVYPTNHNTSVFAPVLDIAVVQERGAHVPSKQTPAYNPKKSEKTVDGEVEVRFEPDEAVQHDCDGEGEDGEEGGCHELLKGKGMSMSSLRWILRPDNVPRQKSKASATCRASSGT